MPGRLIAMPSAIVARASNVTGRSDCSEAGNEAQASTWTPITRTEGTAVFTTPATPEIRPPPPTGTTTVSRSGTSVSSSSPSVA